VVIIGAGPAGLTAAYELSKLGVRSRVLEADSTVGGIARTVNYKGYLFDIGGHRFFTKWDEVNEISCAARNTLGVRHDIWAINTEPDYQEDNGERSKFG